MNGTVAVALVAALASVIGGYFSFRSATQANRVSARKVDLEAFERSQQIYERTIDRLQSQTDRASEQINRLNDQVAKEQDVSNSLRNQCRTLQAQIDLMGQTITDLRTQIGAGARR